MSYAFSVPLKSERAKQEMLEFLKQHFRPWHEIAVGPLKCSKNYDPTWIVCDGKMPPEAEVTEGRLSVGERGMFYDKGVKIGIEYGAGGDSAVDYWMRVCAWIALKSGRRRKFKELGMVPYIVYDGYEAWPVLVASEWKHKVPKKWRWAIADDVGFRQHKYWRSGGIDRPGFREVWQETMVAWDGVVKKELDRLDRLWKEK